MAYAKTATLLLNETLAVYEAKAPKAMAIIENGFDDAIAVFAMPEKYRKRLRTTNGIERLNEEVRRRERVIRIFPNRTSALRLIGLYSWKLTTNGQVAKKYLDMADYWDWRERQANIADNKIVKIC